MPSVLFVDRNLGRKFPVQLRAVGLHVEMHDENFGPHTKDVEWIPVVAERDWIAVTMDDRIRYNPVEQRSVFDSGLRLILLAGKPPLPLHAENLIRTMPAIEGFVMRNPAPWIAKLYRPTTDGRRRSRILQGRIELWRTSLR